MLVVGIRMDQKALYSGQYKAKKSIHDVLPSGRDIELVNELKRTLGARSDPAIAELSVGDGNLSLALARALPAGSFTFVDVSRPHLDGLRELLSLANAPLAKSPAFVEANLDTDFHLLREGRFDAVFALDILEHVFDVFAFVGHCQRILAPGGALFLRVLNVAYARHRLALLAGRLPVTASWFGPRGDLTAWRRTYGWDGGHLHYFTLPVLRDLLTESGLHIERITDAGARWSRLREFAPALLCGNPCLIARRR